MSDRPRGAPFELLVVDDEAFVRETLALYLESEGCVVHTAASGREAIERLGQHGVEAAIIDIRMPGMDGLTLLSELKARAPDLEVLMSTGFQSLETAVEAMRRGACDYITKPITDLENDLFRFVVRAVERRRLRLSNRELSHGLQCAIDRLGGARGEWERHLGTLDALEEFGRRSLRSRSITDLLTATEDLLPRLAAFRAATIAIATRDGGIHASLGDDVLEVTQCEGPLHADTSLDGTAADPGTDGVRWSDAGHEDGSATVRFPLEGAHGLLGELVVRTGAGAHLRETERLVLRAFCDQLALAIPNLPEERTPAIEPGA